MSFERTSVTMVEEVLLVGILETEIWFGQVDVPETVRQAATS